MAKILVNVTNGPEYKTKASIAFTLVKIDINYDHSVPMFLAGYAVQSYLKKIE